MEIFAHVMDCILLIKLLSCNPLLILANRSSCMHIHTGRVKHQQNDLAYRLCGIVKMMLLYTQYTYNPWIICMHIFKSPNKNKNLLNKKKYWKSKHCTLTSMKSRLFLFVPPLCKISSVILATPSKYCEFYRRIQ